MPKRTYALSGPTISLSQAAASLKPTRSAATPRVHWGLLATASAVLMITMGVRQTTGLFVDPIHRDTGIGIAAISFALAVGQFVWGAVQPLFGALAHVPLLLFWGQESALLTATTVARMREARPDMAVAGLPGIGHAPRLVEPLAVAALDRFLAAQP